MTGYVCNRSANPGVWLCLVPDVDDLSDVILGNRVEADDTAEEGLVELEVLLLRTLHAHNVNCVEVSLKMLVSLVRYSRFLSMGLTSVK